MSSKVLVADSSGTMRKILIRALAALGVAETVEAADGAEALARFAEGGVRLVLTEWDMPAMSGLELLHQIRQTDKTTPVIMITAEAEKTRVVAAIEAGCNDYLVKPFTADALIGKLTNYLE
jgi:two-component system, chemotaxis family, chemotaxis protein CheY